MEGTNIITLQKSRDFSQKMNATFEFIRQNFKSMMKSLLFIAGPSVIIASVLLGTLLGDTFGLMDSVNENPEQAEQYFLSMSFWLEMFLMMGFFVISTVMTISAVNNYVILYDEKKTNVIGVDEVWARVRSSFWQYLSTTLMFFFLFIVVYVVLGLVSALFAAISPVLFFFAFLGVLGVMIYLMVGSSMTYFIRSYEKRDFFDAIGRSFKLIQGEWWNTFLFAFVIAFIMYTIAFLAIIPFYIFMVVEMLNNVEATSSPTPSESSQWITTVMFTVYYIISMLTNLLAFVGISFQYFHLVEVKEARGLMSQIQSIGAVSEPQKTSEEDY